MADLFATLNGNKVTAATVHLPYFGIWTADVSIDQAVALHGQVSLVLGDITLVGTVNRGGSYAGAATYGIVGGYLGWQSTVAPRSYTHNVGVKLSTVLSDAAAEVGERLSLGADAVLGPFYTRQSAPAVRLLNSLAVTGWYVGTDGVTRTGARTSKTITSKFDVISADPSLGKAMVATESLIDVVPGNVANVGLATPITISNVVHSVSKGSLRTELWGTV